MTVKVAAVHQVTISHKVLGLATVFLSKNLTPLVGEEFLYMKMARES
jgi:hypothetical protein